MSKPKKLPRLHSLVTGIDMAGYTNPLKGETLVYLGEIPNMLGHGIYAGRADGRVIFGYHLDEFRELSEEET